MSIVVKDSGQDFTPAPEALHKVVCCDVVDGITRETKWGTKDKVAIYWETEAINPETKKPYIVRQEYTPSLDKKSNLRGDLESWRGKKFTEEELKGFDLERVIGCCGQMQVIHNTTPDGKVYANPAALLPLPNGAERITVSKDFIRHKDREQKEKDRPVGQTAEKGKGTTEF